jgi:predicted transposase YbfD/YdcC
VRRQARRRRLGQRRNLRSRASEFFEQFLDLSRGIPSHDTFGRTFALLDSERFSECFITWMQSLIELDEVVALDGKTLRGSFDQATGLQALHVVSAYATNQGLCVGQLAVDSKANEIVALPELIEMLDLSGCVVTADAMGCQKSIAAVLMRGHADYILHLKANHPRLLAEVELAFEESREHDSKTQCVEHYHCDKCHGRIEVRKVRAFERLDWLERRSQWHGLQSVIEIESTRHVGEEVSVERRYYLSSLPASNPEHARKFNRSIRAHWGIENKLHWVLDVVFNEDGSRIRKGAAPLNMALMRKLALNLHRLDTSSKHSLRSKMKRVMMNPGTHLPRIFALAHRL